MDTSTKNAVKRSQRVMIRLLREFVLGRKQWMQDFKSFKVLSSHFHHSRNHHSICGATVANLGQFELCNYQPLFRFKWPRNKEWFSKRLHNIQWIAWIFTQKHYELSFQKMFFILAIYATRKWPWPVSYKWIVLLTKWLSICFCAPKIFIAVII